jgi:hypothetical protein
MGLYRGQIIELSGAVGDVATGIAHGGFRLAFWFEVRSEGLLNINCLI